MNATYFFPQPPRFVPRLTPPRPLEGRRVLLVEDCPDQQRLLAAQLQRSGARVTLECNGKSAVRLVERSAKPFDVVVMDFAMPVMDGIEATRQLRARGYRGAIVGITATSYGGTEQRWLEAGCDVFLQKPLDVSQFFVAISPLISKNIDRHRREEIHVAN
jgi:CheY-like chemotaxis protein